jgi:uncharacterized membrane protein (UPF0127 family)
MEKRITFLYKKKRVNLIAEECNFLQKFVGLMFSRREKAKILLFKFGKKGKIAIHSLFVFYPFVAVWLDEKNRVVDLKIVKSFLPYISHKNKADKLIEVPISKKYDDILTLLVGD